MCEKKYLVGDNLENPVYHYIAEERRVLSKIEDRYEALHRREEVQNCES